VCAVGILIEGTNAERHEDGENCYGLRENWKLCPGNGKFLTWRGGQRTSIFFKFSSNVALLRSYSFIQLPIQLSWQLITATSPHPSPAPRRIQCKRLSFHETLASRKLNNVCGELKRNCEQLSRNVHTV
jgi:hypothetical protein